MKRTQSVDLRGCFFMMLCLACLVVHAETGRLSGSERELVAFVQSAKAYALTQGRYKAIMAFNDPKGVFRREGRYIFAEVCGDPKNNGFILASNPRLQDARTFTDGSRNPIVRKFIKTATAEGAWFDYRWNDPVTDQIEAKHSYVIFMPKVRLCIGSGIYQKQT